jgi:hypothetical protein
LHFYSWPVSSEPQTSLADSSWGHLGNALNFAFLLAKRETHFIRYVSKLGIRKRLPLQVTFPRTAWACLVKKCQES